MTFEDFWRGQPLNYMGSDGLEYIANVRRAAGFSDIKETVITRSDGKAIKVGGRVHRHGYVIGFGSYGARMMYDEAIRFPFVDNTTTEGAA
jgi:hypothetical protein